MNNTEQAPRTLATQEVIDQLKSDLNDYIRMRDGWKPESAQYATYDLAVRIHQKLITKVESLRAHEIENIQDAYRDGALNWCNTVPKGIINDHSTDYITQTYPTK